MPFIKPRGVVAVAWKRSLYCFSLWPRFNVYICSDVHVWGLGNQCVADPTCLMHWQLILARLWPTLILGLSDDYTCDHSKYSYQRAVPIKTVHASVWEVTGQEALCNSTNMRNKATQAKRANSRKIQGY